MDDLVAKKYRLIRPIGSGGAGTVYEAEHATLKGRRVAVKLLAPDRASDVVVCARLVREAQTAASIAHPGIVAIHDVDFDEGVGPVIVMELLDGASLDHVVTRKVLSPGQAVRLGLAVLDALAAAHARGVVHRDLKPGNLFVVRRPDGHETIKVLDFGIAKAADEPTMTKPGQFVGTVVYASPEHFESANQADARSDLYSLGATLFVALTGASPGLPHAPTRDARLRQAFADAGTPAALVAALGCALALDREARFASAAEMAAAFAALLAAGEVAPDPRPLLAGLPARSSDPAPALPAALLRRRWSDTAPTADGTDTPPPTLPAASPVAALVDEARATFEAADASRETRDESASTPPRVAPRASSLPLATDARADVATDPVPSPGYRRAWPRRAAVVGLVLAVGAAAVATLRPPRAPVVAQRVPVVPPPAPAVVPPAPPPPLPDANAGLLRACRAWSSALAARQHPRGGFAGIQQQPPAGWDTAQELVALLHAERACGGLTASQREAALGALAAFRQPQGWGGAATDVRVARPMTLATSWALLALALAASPADRAAAARVAEVRALLARAQLADGGFAVEMTPGPTARAAGYPTVLALWALLESEAVDRSVPTVAARERAAAWLARALTGDAPGDGGRTASLRDVAGLAEQALWVLWRAQGGAHPRDDGALLAALARELVARCDLDRATTPHACARSIDDDGVVAIQRPGAEAMMVSTLWFPWVLVAAAALAADPPAALDAATRDDLGAVAAWGAARVAAEHNRIHAMPGFRLAEHVLAVSLVARSPGPTP